MDVRRRARAPIVVGVDGSDASKAALVFALREAIARGTTVQVITAWWFDAPHASVSLGMGEEAHALAQLTQDRVVAAALAEVPQPPVISRFLVEDDPVRALLAASRNALCLVVGRGRAGIVRSELLGSVSEQCIRGASCPVTVVQPREAHDGPEASMLPAPVPTP